MRIRCPNCSAQINAAPQHVGKAALCGNCGEPIIVSTEPVAATSSSESFTPPPSSRARETSAARRPAELYIADDRGGRNKLLPKLLYFVAIPVLVVVIVWAAFWVSRSTEVPHNRMSCANNLKMIGLALHNYRDVYGTFPPAFVADENGRPMHSWRVLILPFLEEEFLYQQYDFSEPWDGPNNRRLLDTQPPRCFQCPSETQRGFFTTDYMVIVGDNAAFAKDGESTLGAAGDDALLETILVVEVAGSTTHWMEPRDLSLDQMSMFINRRENGTAISSSHDDGAHVLLADGSAQFLSDETSPQIVVRLIDPRDGYGVGDFGGHDH